MYLGPRPNFDKKFPLNILSYFPGVEALSTIASSIFLAAMVYRHTEFAYPRLLYFHAMLSSANWRLTLVPKQRDPVTLIRTNNLSSSSRNTC